MKIKALESVGIFYTRACILGPERPYQEEYVFTENYEIRM